MPEETASRRRFLELGGIGLTGIFAGCTDKLSPAQTSPHQSSESTASTRSDTETQTDESVYSQVYRDAISSVVSVTTGQGQGTGFCYDDAHVVTNAHVVGNAETVQIRFDEGTWVSGTVRGTDAHSDLAVIDVDSVPDSATPLSFTQSAPAIGQEVVTIGNPYNLEGTVTTGIVSGTDRSIPAPSGYRIPDAIQTDAAVNPGNSGGPLMSLEGTVVGVVNSKRGDNIAFGISAALTQRVVPELIETGAYDHAYMGVSFEDVTPTIAAANGLDEPRGIVAVETVSGGPADGVLRGSTVRAVDGRRVPVGGDVLLAVDDTPIESFEDLAGYLALETTRGDTVEATVLRDGTERTLELTLDARPERSRSPLR